MTVNTLRGHTLRGVATALFLGAATFAGTAVLTTAPAIAAVRFSVGTPLKEAQTMMAAGNYKGAMAKVNEAEAVSGKTAEESKIIAQFKDAIAVASGDTSTAKGALAKFSKDYNANKFKEVIADGDTLKKTGTLDATNMLIIAQAYYQSGDKAGCEKYIKNNFASPSDRTLELLVRCAYDNQDEETQHSALETLVAHTGKAPYWNSLLKLSEHAQGMSDYNTLDIYRLKMLTGNMEKDDYSTLASLALRFNFYAEAQSVLEKGQAAKILTDDRTNKLLAVAKGQAGADIASMTKNIATATAAPQGDALVKVGEDQIGQGKAKDAIATIQAGMKKPLANQGNAQTRLGMAYLYGGQKADAVKAFDAVKGPAGDKTAMVAHLWSLYARH